MISRRDALQLTKSERLKLNFSKIHRWFIFVLLLAVAATTFVLLRRFAIWQLPSAWHSRELPAGSTLLMDWDCQRGRSLQENDWIVWREDKLYFGKIMAVMAETASSRAQGKCYLVQLAGGTGEARTWHWLEESKVRARVLLVWSSPDQTILPK